MLARIQEKRACPIAPRTGDCGDSLRHTEIHGLYEPVDRLVGLWSSVPKKPKCQAALNQKIL